MKTKSLVLILSLLASTSLFSQIPSYVSTNGLVGYWPFNGNANDASGNGNNGTVNGATVTTDRNGNANGAYSFDGVDDEFSIGNSNSFDNLSQMTISIWVNFASLPNYQSALGGHNLFSKMEPVGANATGSFSIYTEYDYDALRFDTRIGGGNQINLRFEPFSTFLTTNTWNHIVAIYDGSKNKIYWNGQLVAVSSNSVIGLIDNTTFDIYTSNDYQNIDRWNGKTDEISLWNRALTQQEITALYQSNNCSVPAYVPTNGLVGYWPFCGNANDVSGNGNNGVLNNGVSNSNDRYGNSNSAFLFDGVDDYIQTINAGPNGTGISLSYWYKTSVFINNGANCANIFSYGGSSWGTLFEANFNHWSAQTTGPCFGPSMTAAGTLISRGGIPIPDSTKWHHVVIVLPSGATDLNAVKFYFDGIELLGTCSFANYGAPNLNIGTANPIRIGSGYQLNGVNFQGILDDIGIWNRTLTPLEIQQLYNSTPCTKPAIVTLGTSATTVRCPNDSVSIFVVEPTGPGLFYEWYRNGTALPTATASSITVSDIAKYKVAVRTGPGVDCQRISGIVQTTTATPPVITITAPNGNAYCPGDSVLLTATGATAGYSYQWKRFGVAIPGATSANFNATQTGNYRCEVTNAGGCISLSNIIGVTNGTSCRVMQEQPSDVSVYPNPAKNSFTVSFNDIGNEIPVSIELRNLQGQIIENRMLNGITDVQFNTGKLSPSMYLVRIMLESGDVVEKNVMVE
ncbi:MAG: LamG-like jellyroll fold domain-containing protein [Bacteroidota bacterium]